MYGGGEDGHFALRFLVGPPGTTVPNHTYSYQPVNCYVKGTGTLIGSPSFPGGGGAPDQAYLNAGVDHDEGAHPTEH